VQGVLWGDQPRFIGRIGTAVAFKQISGFSRQAMPIGMVRACAPQ